MNSSRRRRVFSVALVVVVSLALGVLGTIANTCRIAVRPEPYPVHVPAFASAANGPHWMYQKREARGMIRLDGTSISGTIPAAGALPAHAPPSWSRLAKPPTAQDQSGTVIEEGFGWPTICLTCEWKPTAGFGARMPFSPVNAIALSKVNPHDRNRMLAIPTRPAWRGLIINSLLLAVAVLPIVLAARVAVRRLATRKQRRRKREGLCLACGYDLQGVFDSGCPECGWNRPPQPAPSTHAVHASDISAST